MKIFVFIALAIAFVAASPDVSSNAKANVNTNKDAEPEVKTVESADYVRQRKAAYGGGGGGGGYGGGASSGGSIAAPPCPRNYLFSCQPSLAPVPCASSAPASSGSYGSPQGAYSAPVPTYVETRERYNVPQPYAVGYLPQGAYQYFQY